MSRITEREVAIPSGVEVAVSDSTISVKGKHGELSVPRSDGVSTEQQNGVLRIQTTGTSRHARAMTGTITALVKNMIKGVSDKWEKRLQIEGVGYRAQFQNNVLVMQLGFSHPVEFVPPTGIELSLPSPTEVVITGVDRQLVGQVAADIRSKRPPEPYKGKGIRYQGEYIKRKEVKK